MTPDPAWKLQGEIDPSTRQPIYIERRPNVKRVHKIDPRTGDKTYIYDKQGVATKPVWELILDPDQPYVEREFVLADLGNGIVKKNYHFRSSEADRIRRQMASQKVPQDVLQQQVAQLLQRVQELETELRSEEISAEEVEAKVEEFVEAEAEIEELGVEFDITDD